MEDEERNGPQFTKYFRGRGALKLQRNFRYLSEGLVMSMMKTDKQIEGRLKGSLDHKEIREMLCSNYLPASLVV